MLASDAKSEPHGGELRDGAYVPIACIIVAFAAIAVLVASKLNLYIDELYSLHTTGRGFAYALQQSLGFEQQPPLFFLALTAWRSIDASDLFARLFSIVCAVATLLVVWIFSRRHLLSLPSWMAPLAFALNPFFLWAALDIRVYALIVLLSASLVALFFEAFVRERASLPQVVAFTVVAIAALYTQYFLGLLLVGCAIAIAAARAWRSVIPFACSMIVVALAVLPLLLGSVASEFKDATAVLIVTPPILAERMLASTLAFAFPHAWLDGGRILTILYLATIVVLFALMLRRTRPSTATVALGAIVATMIALFLVIILVLRTPLEMPRHISSLFAPTLLLMLASLGALHPPRERKRIGAAYIVVLLLLSVASDARDYRLPLSNSGDWQRVGDYLNARVAASEPVAVFDPEAVLGVEHYYRGAARIVPIPAKQSFTVFDRRAFTIGSAAELARVFPAASPSTGRAWLVFGVTACTMIEIGSSCQVLDSYLAAHFRTLEERRFNGTTVRELEALRRVGFVRRDGPQNIVHPRE